MRTALLLSDAKPFSEHECGNLGAPHHPCFLITTGTTNTTTTFSKKTGVDRGTENKTTKPTVPSKTQVRPARTIPEKTKSKIPEQKVLRPTRLNNQANNNPRTGLRSLTKPRETLIKATTVAKAQTVTKPVAAKPAVKKQTVNPVKRIEALLEHSKGVGIEPPHIEGVKSELKENNTTNNKAMRLPRKLAPGRTKVSR